MARLVHVQYWRSVTTPAASGSHRTRCAAAAVSSCSSAGAFGGVPGTCCALHKGEHSEIDDVIWDGDGQLSFRRCLGTSLISEVVIGMGASLGREAAPKLLGGASASALATGRTVHTAERLLVAARRAGLAAVYNVPLGGALFTAESSAAPSPCRSCSPPWPVQGSPP